MSRLKFDAELYFGSNRIYCPASGTAKLVNWVDFFGRTCVSGVCLNEVVNTATTTLDFVHLSGSKTIIYEIIVHDSPILL